LQGNFHAVFNGSFFYVTDAKEGNPKIVRLDLFTGKIMGGMDIVVAFGLFLAMVKIDGQFS